MDENEISHVIIGAAIEAHRELGGPGLIEDIYDEPFCCEMQLHGLQVERQKPVPVVYKGNRLKRPLHLDILVNDKVIVEAKAIEKYNTLFAAQLLTYLRLPRKKLGLVVNFDEILLKNGVHRVVNNL